jgi:multiple sugar transport system permease protein
MKLLRSTAWYATSIAVSVIFLFPVYWMFSVSLKRPEEIFRSPPAWYPSEPQFSNFRVLFTEGDAWTIVNSLIIAGSSTVIAMALGALCAYGIVRYKVGGEHLPTFIIAQRLLPPIAIVFPLFIVYAQSGFADTYHGLILLYSAFALPFVIWMLRGFLMEVPVELEEAALVDGCTRFGVFWRVVLPMARNGLFATAVFAFIYSWNEFLFALVMTRNNVMTYTVQISNYFGPQSTFWAKISAMSVLGTIPVLIVVAVMQRYLVRGLTFGAVKG